VIFNLEIIIKVFGEGRHYFASDWNLFDFFVVICGDIGICIALAMPSVDFANMFIILRALRLLRIFKSLKGFEHLKLIMDTGYIIVQPICSVLVIFILTNFIFAIVGMYLFSNLMYQSHYNELNNFRNFFSA
jgi:voltage-gated sodium channel